MSQFTEIVSAQKSLEESFNRRMMELEAQLHSGVPAKDTVAKVAEEFRSFRELMFNMLGLLRKQIMDCHRSVDMLETRHRRKHLIFLGVPEIENEDCTATTMKLVHNKLKLADFTSSDLSVCHRLGGSNSAEHHRPILVQFSSLHHRSIVWRSKTALKGTTICIREFLTKTRQAIFTKARLHFGMRACWTQDGVIVIKAADGSRHKLVSPEELEQLQAKYPKTLSSGSSSSRSVPATVGASGHNMNNKNIRK